MTLPATAARRQNVKGGSNPALQILLNKQFINFFVVQSNTPDWKDGLGWSRIKLSLVLSIIASLRGQILGGNRIGEIEGTCCEKTNTVRMGRLGIDNDNSRSRIAPLADGERLFEKLTQVDILTIARFETVA